MDLSFGVLSFELLNGIFSPHRIVPVDPLIVRVWIAFPLDEVLQFAPTSVSAGV
jgi:hypothetical protein